MNYVLLIIGFFLLIKGADLFVEGASNIAKFFKVPSLVIGLTIVSIGTSAPEASVSITAALAASEGISIGNIIGSNIFNIAVVVGLCSLITPIKVDKNLIKTEFPYMIISSIVALVLFIDGKITRIEGFILLALFTLFMLNIIIFSLKNKTYEKAEKVNILLALLFSAIGAAAIIFGGDLVVNSAKAIAQSFNVSDTLIGLTVVAIGTSLPELVTSVVAAKKGESDIALGNVIGSSIFNLLFILGLSTSILPISIQTISLYDLIIFIAISIFLYIIAKAKGVINRLPAFAMLVIYVIYNIYIFNR